MANMGAWIKQYGVVSVLAIGLAASFIYTSFSTADEVLEAKVETKISIISAAVEGNTEAIERNGEAIILLRDDIRGIADGIENMNDKVGTILEWTGWDSEILE